MVYEGVCVCASAVCAFSLLVYWVSARHISSLVGQVPQWNAGNASQWWVMVTVCQRKRATEEMEEESEMTQTDSADIVQITDEHRHTPRKKIIVHFDSTINQLAPWTLGNLGWYLDSRWGVCANLRCESQKQGAEEGRTFNNRETICRIQKQGV